MQISNILIYVNKAKAKTEFAYISMAAYINAVISNDKFSFFLKLSDNITQVKLPLL